VFGTIEETAKYAGGALGLVWFISHTAVRDAGPDNEAHEKDRFIRRENVVATAPLA